MLSRVFILILMRSLYTWCYVQDCTCKYRIESSCNIPPDNSYGLAMNYIVNKQLHILMNDILSINVEVRVKSIISNKNYQSTISQHPLPIYNISPIAQCSLLSSLIHCERHKLSRSTISSHFLKPSCLNRRLCNDSKFSSI